ncbi:MAG TPA: prepilin-type N-terminal cleavage/methylation domain-containing protein [Vicinamibacterales bacterium]|nr:prepilin-type N-terminal cleavage/methylation domain-containing protein [Vicinamibacterales bacterium]
MRADRGFSIVELLVATLVMLAVSAAAFALLNPSTGALQAQSEAVDVQQRLRAGASMLYGDLAAAGAGPDRGPRAGPLVQSFAPVLPFRRGTNADDPPGTFFTDRMTILSVPAAAPHATLAAAGPPLDSDAIGVDPQPQCPPIDPLCFFAAGTSVAIFDESAHADLVSITAVSSSYPTPFLQHANQRLAFTAYPPSTTSVVGMSMASYALDRAGIQLVVSNGGVDAPVISNVVDLAFTYYGDPQPPQIGTYGPQPPPIDEQAPGLAWPPGENCAFAVVAGAQVPRLAVLGAGPALVPLSAAQLTDGPWCPDAANANRWDADLLRVRAVGVQLRVQAAIAALRGPAGVLFTVAGTGRDASRWVPDREVTFRVSPRNMNLGRAP